jgi:hypothetical protein
MFSTFPYLQREILRTRLRIAFKVDLILNPLDVRWLTITTAWRKLLKDLTVYFREIQASYDVRSKATMRMSTTVNATLGPPELLKSGGINEALNVLRNFHRIALGEANRAKEIEEDVINQLNLLRNDLNQKIKEIKGLSGDFKNSVEKERDNTRRMVESLKGAISSSEQDPSSASGKGDPFIIRLGVDRQVEKQIDEENYLHRVCRVDGFTATSADILIGLSQPGELWSRIGVYHRGRDSKGIQCLCHDTK